MKNNVIKFKDTRAERAAQREANIKALLDERASISALVRHFHHRLPEIEAQLKNYFNGKW